MNKNISNFKFLAICTLVISVLASCDKDDDTPKGVYENGVFIVNEGNFQANNGSVSFYNYGADSVSNNIFKEVNNRVLGDVVQSIKLSGDNAFIVVNNSNKVEVVNRYTFEEEGVVEGITQPRYVEVNGSKGYVSCWDKTVKVIDINTFEILKSIDVGSGAERMLITNGNLYVANGGAYGTDSTISVISLETEDVVANINVKYNPKSLVLDKSGNIWALCSGKEVYDGSWNLVDESPAKLYKIDVATNQAVLEIELFASSHPTRLQIDNDGTTLYHDGGFGAPGIYSLVVDDVKATMTKIIDKSAYGFSYDSQTNVLFVCDAGSFQGAGTLYRYETDGKELGSYEVGIGPNGTGFKHTKQ